MRAYHHSQIPRYRRPFGAVVSGTVLRLAIDVWDDPEVKVTLRTWFDGLGERLIPMVGEDVFGASAPDSDVTGELVPDTQALGSQDPSRQNVYSYHAHRVLESCPSGDHRRFSCELPTKELGNLWYSFILEGSDGRVLHYGAQEGRTGGEGWLYGGLPPSFQITVYQDRPESEKPDWFKHGVVYQIFPDRFRRDDAWKERGEKVVAQKRAGIPKRLVESWDEPPVYDRDEEGKVLHWDFYGGSLNGIREALPYLAELGITVLYLNPIFEAASNHRYDTADYLHIDPLLGSDADFANLAKAAEELGMSIMLDGVFNHTGDDSRYFNRYGNYNSIGAWQSDDSPYRHWYLLDSEHRYASWWGIEDLPAMDKQSPAWQSFIYGPQGVVEHWLKQGARGWRLDVADELTDAFIAGIKGAEMRVKPDAMLLGEVWEDASNKIAYGEMRHYLNGKELDSVMNYPFREAVIAFLREDLSGEAMAARLGSLKENYPPLAFYTTLNLLGSHDRARILTLLGGAPLSDHLNEQQQKDYILSESQRGLAKGRFWLASLLQMCSPGVPSIYYGDEAGLEGYTDPYNRSTYPWGHEDRDTQTMIRNALRLRQCFDFLTDGDYLPFSSGPSVYGFWRFGDGEGACVLVNRSLSETCEVQIPQAYPLMEELIAGRPLEKRDGKLIVKLYPLGSAFVYGHEPSVLAKELKRGSGVLCHITSLPNGDKPGTLGKPALDFVDYLAATGQRYWQVLPVTPPDSYGSPYAGISAFAGNPALIFTGEETLEDLFVRFVPDRSFEAFVADHESWLWPYSLFMALKDRFGADQIWQQWPEHFRTYDRSLNDDPELAKRALYHQFVQYLFQIQWDELHRYANEKGISIIGDMPMYVSEDCADTWSRPEVFNLDENGFGKEQAGTPPDNFAADGQLWGNPTYNWKALKEEGYQWWIDRLGRSFELYDVVRLDHFLGFAQYYSIPQGASARDGQWLRGPGVELFKAAATVLGPLPIIAEDLGTITPVVRALVAQCGFPAMDVVEFYDGDPRFGYNAHPSKIVYTSTHDTNTLIGWLAERFFEGDEETHQEDLRTLSHELMGVVENSSNSVVIVPLQDVLWLGSDARMNVPGVAEGNWTWQASKEELDRSLSYLRELTEKAGRS